MIKRNTIKWRIFQYNIIVIVVLIALVSIIFNIAVRMYIESDTVSQLYKISSHAVDAAQRQSTNFYHGAKKPGIKKPLAFSTFTSPSSVTFPGISENEKVFRYYDILNRALREPLSMLNAEYILLDENKNVITPPNMYQDNFSDLSNQIVDEIAKSSENFNKQEYIELKLSGTNYIAVVKPISQKNELDLSWIIIYSSLQKVNQFQVTINIILVLILIFSSLVIVAISSRLSQKLSTPFDSLNEHIKAISEREFGTQINVPVYDELQQVVNSINVMSQKLESYDKAQKTFFQNVSHEFRTPLMSIQSYAEGIKYGVVENSMAVDVILDESKRMTKLLEELLYLSRLDAIEESYHFEEIELSKLINSCVNRFNEIAIQKNIQIITNFLDDVRIIADEEKLARALTNIISNCIRYAVSKVTLDAEVISKNKVKIRIYDDGPGFDAKDLPYLFERFYKGKKGNFGLGLTISKTVIEKHKGKISASNYDFGGALFLIELNLEV